MNLNKLSEINVTVLLTIVLLTDLIVKDTGAFKLV